MQLYTMSINEVVSHHLEIINLQKAMQQTALKIKMLLHQTGKAETCTYRYRYMDVCIPAFVTYCISTYFFILFYVLPFSLQFSTLRTTKLLYLKVMKSRNLKRCRRILCLSSHREMIQDAAGVQKPQEPLTISLSNTLSILRFTNP